MAQQLTFDLPSRPALGREDFLIAPSNAAAVALLAADWPGGRMVLVGPHGSGKSHLTHVWATETGASIVSARRIAEDNDRLFDIDALAIEDVHRAAGTRDDEEALFHALNARATRGAQTLMTSLISPAHVEFILPDLQSRLQGSAAAVLDPPDDTLLAAVMRKLFRDRQMSVAPDAVAFLIKRMERSFSTLQALVDELDREALSSGRAITRPLATQVLDKMAASGPQ